MAYDSFMGIKVLRVPFGPMTLLWALMKVPASISIRQLFY